MPTNFDIKTLESITIQTTETTVAHTLGRTPVDGWIIARSGSGNVFRGSTAWTSTDIYLTASVAVTITLLIF